MTQTEACKTEIEMLQNSSGQASTRIAELQKLLHFTEHTDMLQEFKETIFTEYAYHIIVYSRKEVGFELKCGLTLRKGCDYMSHTPYGYRRENGKAVIDKAVASTIRELLENHLSRMGLSNAAKKAGLETYHNSTAKRMMLNKHY